MTPNQKRMFFAELRKTATSMGLTDNLQVDGYRLTVLHEEANAESTTEVRSRKQFDRVMRRIYADRGDYERAANVGVYDAHKVAEMIDDCTRQVFELSGRSGGRDERIAYALSVLGTRYKAAKIVNSDTWWLDVDPAKPMRVFYSLDTHRRRMLKRLSIERGVQYPLAYRHGTKYV